MNDVDRLAGPGRWPLGVGEQLEQSNASLQFETTLIVDRTDHRDLLRVILLDEDVNLKVLVKLRVSRRDLFRQLTFSQTRGFDISVSISGIRIIPLPSTLTASRESCGRL